MKTQQTAALMAAIVGAQDVPTHKEAIERINLALSVLGHAEADPTIQQACKILRGEVTL